MTMVAEQFRFVIGVDTHAASHSAAVVEAATGAVVAERKFDATSSGLSIAVDWREVGESAHTLVVVEG